MKYLLDVNVLMAAIIQAHRHYPRTAAWLKEKQLVLCPLSELGFLRITTNKKISGLGLDMAKARQALERFASERKIERIHDDLPALDSRPRTSDQVTDHYLADLAARHGLKLATLDEQLKHSSAELVS